MNFLFDRFAPAQQFVYILPTSSNKRTTSLRSVNHSCDSAIHREAVPNGVCVCDGIREVVETRVFQKCLEHVFD